MMLPKAVCSVLAVASLASFSLAGALPGSDVSLRELEVLMRRSNPNYGAKCDRKSCSRCVHRECLMGCFDPMQKAVCMSA